MEFRLRGLLRNPLYTLLFFAILLSGCVDSGDAKNDKALTEAEEQDLANQTFNYINEAFLKPQGLDGRLVAIGPSGEELYIVNFSVGGEGMGMTHTEAYVTSGGKLILGRAIDINQPPETHAPPQTAAPTGTQRTSVDIDGDSCLGSEDAPVTIIEFSDYQCPFCARFWEQTLPQLKKEYVDTGKVRLVYRDFPLHFHASAQKAAEATECADDQGKFWEMHDKIFEGQNEWSKDAEIIFKSYASELGLDETEFESCLNSGKYTDEVKKDLEDGTKAGVTGTPAFFVNGILLSGALPFSEFKSIIDAELASTESASTITGTCG